MTSHAAGTARTPSRRWFASIALACVGAVVLAGTAWAAPGEDESPCDDGVKACARLSDHTAWLTDGGGELLAGPVRMNHGGRSQPTPTGHFTVQWKNIDHHSSEAEDIPMPYSVFFDLNGRAFHAGDVRSNSAGCVRLPEAAAEQFFAELQPGDRVQILP